METVPRLQGVLGHLYAYYMESALQPQPAYGLAACLAYGAMVCGRRWFQPAPLHASSNLYILAVGAASTGKEGVRTLISRAAAAADISEWVERGGWTSPGAIALGIKDAPNHLMIADEISHLIQAANGRNADPNLSQMIGSLLELFSVRGRWSPRKYSRQNREDFAFIVDRPCLSLVGLSTRDRLARYLSNENIEDGLMPRFLVFEGPTEGRADSIFRGEARKEPPFPSDVAAWASQARCVENNQYSGSTLRNSVIRPFSREARDILADFFEDARSGWPTNVVATLHSRCEEHAGKLALILSVSLDPFSCPGEIDGEAALCAVDIARYSMDCAESFLDAMGEDSQWSKARASIAAHIRAAGVAGITKKELHVGCKAFRNLSAPDKNRMISDLQESEDVRVETVKKYRRPVMLLTASQHEDDECISPVATRESQCY